MNNFNTYLKKLAEHSAEKNQHYLKNSRNNILVNAGVSLNWLGDYLANPKIIWQEKTLPMEKIQFSGTNPKWNKILINECQRSATKFKRLISKNPKLGKEFLEEASFDDEIILVRKSSDKGYRRVLDGMHRFVGAVIKNKKKIKVWLPINEEKHLPICETHVVYDLIRGFERNADDRQGRKELYYALRLLSRTYENVPSLLKKRFNEDYVHNKDVQTIIRKILKK